MDCDICRFGQLQPHRSSFVGDIAGQIMVIPNAPAYKCDMCGHVEYDGAFLGQLQYVMDHLVETNDNHPKPQRSSLRQRRAFWQPPRKV